MDIKLLRLVGFLEGVSMLVLLFVAMPMKYFGGNPALVPYAGLAHGVLFLLFFVLLLAVSHLRKWSVGMFLFGLAASLLPFGPFVFDAKVKKQEAV